MFAVVMAMTFTSCKKEDINSKEQARSDQTTYHAESVQLFSRIKNKLLPNPVNGSYYQINGESTVSALTTIENEMVTFVAETEGQQVVSQFHDIKDKITAELNTAPSLKPVVLPEEISEASANQLVNELFLQLDNQVQVLQLGETNEMSVLGDQLLIDVKNDAKEMMRNQLLTLKENDVESQSTSGVTNFDASGIAFTTDRTIRTSIADFKNTIDAKESLSNDQKNAMYAKANFLSESLDLSIGLAMLNQKDDNGMQVQGLFSWLKNVVKVVAKAVAIVVIGVAVVLTAGEFGSGANYMVAPLALGGWLYYQNNVRKWINGWW